MPEHNHVTRDIKPPGECPGCDAYHQNQEPDNGRESEIRGESPLSRASRENVERAALLAQLEAGGHSGCAYDLQHADQFDLPTVAYAVAEHVEEACGDPDFSGDPELAAKIREWADGLERVDPAVARKVTMPVTVHRDGTQLIVDVNPDDMLDLADENVKSVFLAVRSERLIEFRRVDQPPGRNGQS